MALFAEQLARLRVAVATGSVSLDLGRWAVETLAELAPVAERTAARNVLLRTAAARVGGTRWAKARRLSVEIAGVRGAPQLAATGGGDGVRELVSEALALDPEGAPASMRQLVRIIED